ncbi:MAG: guanylate kinase [Elusimicrobia bacterium RIFOXYD2_FULL_34_15]|nr:MAG: guanylate kinase [Elusimicrobia bacterium RIFOXYD2_FULL_34_15]
MKLGIPIVLSAPSGAGKTTLVNLILKKIKGLGHSISTTTRPPLHGERNGKDYFFLSKREFLRKKKANKFVETAIVHGYYYGTLKEQLDKNLKAGKNVVLNIDVKGALNVKKIYPESLLIFIVPPSMNILKRRLKDRQRDTEKEIEKRLKNAKKEMKYQKYYDYVVVNDILQEAFNKIKRILKLHPNVAG